MMFLGNLNFLAIAVIGGLRVSAGQLSIGDIQAFIQYSRQFTQPLTQLASMANVLQSGIASLERVFELLDVDEQSPDPADPLHRRRARRVGSSSPDVTFSYDPSRPLIEDLSLVAEPGADRRHRRPHRRRQDHAGQPGHAVLRARRRRHLARRHGHRRDAPPRPARQRRHGAAGHVAVRAARSARTSRFGNPDATDEQIVEAAKATYVDHFVRSLPDGYDTVVDDEGSSVSRRREAAPHDRPRLPGRPDHPDPRRGDQLGRHPHRGADPEGDGRAAHATAPAS